MAPLKSSCFLQETAAQGWLVGGRPVLATVSDAKLAYREKWQYRCVTWKLLQIKKMDRASVPIARNFDPRESLSRTA
ncbi:hypothetical protein, partial [Bradyrhizobium sp. sGM-13]|uniref:hypothetical protein n=1 Tax=Bradyrhizobium sp. sGM-13 TaxID=2831781 RepID=UPI001BCF74F6